MSHTRRALVFVIAITVSAIVLSSPSSAAQSDDGWGPAQPADGINSSAADGCPIESPDGRSLYFASMRNGTHGGNDIWVADRQNEREPWSLPVNLGEPVNSAANDFCPTPLHGKQLLFVSERPGANTCNARPGAGDIYLTRLNPAHGASEPQHLGCVSNGTGPNFDGPEFSPSLVTTDAGTWLFFSSTGYDANMDLYVSERRDDGSFAPPTKVTELSTTADDRMPNVSRNGLTMVFASNRTDLDGEQGDFDVYVAHRSTTAEPWSQPVNLGPNVNTAAAETRPSLSADLDRLYFGRLGDIWISARVA